VVELLEDRYKKGECFPTAGFGSAEDVAALEG
jgi:hypothetical protein